MEATHPAAPGAASSNNLFHTCAKGLGSFGCKWVIFTAEHPKTYAVYEICLLMLFEKYISPWACAVLNLGSLLDYITHVENGKFIDSSGLDVWQIVQTNWSNDRSNSGLRW